MIIRNEKKNKILIVEDDSDLLHLIEKLLKINNYQVSHTKNGEKGIKLIKKKEPDLIICDIMLQGNISGFEVLDEIRNEPRFLLTPFIFITGRTDRTDYRKGMELGADDYIFKPFTEEELLKAINIQLLRAEAIKGNLNIIQPQPVISGPNGDEVYFTEIIEKEKKFTDADQILVTVEKEPTFLKLSKLVCITSLGDYSSVFTSDNCRFVIRKTMKWWENKLPEKSFFRIHRSTIINLNFIDKIERWFNNAYRVHLKNIGKPFMISRRSGSKLKAKFS